MLAESGVQPAGVAAAAGDDQDLLGPVLAGAALVVGQQALGELPEGVGDAEPVMTTGGVQRVQDITLAQFPQGVLLPAFALVAGERRGGQAGRRAARVANNPPAEVEVVLVAPDRPRRALLLQASPLHDSKGHVSGAMLTGHDVTDLRASVARFRAAFHDGPTPIARLTREGVVHEINPALRRLTGKTTNALTGGTLADHVHP